MGSKHAMQPCMSRTGTFELVFYNSLLSCLKGKVYSGRETP